MLGHLVFVVVVHENDSEKFRKILKTSKSFRKFQNSSKKHG